MTVGGFYFGIALFVGMIVATLIPDEVPTWKRIIWSAAAGLLWLPLLIACL